MKTPIQLLIDTFEQRTASYKCNTIEDMSGLFMLLIMTIVVENQLELEKEVILQAYRDGMQHSLGKTDISHHDLQYQPHKYYEKTFVKLPATHDNQIP